MLTVIFVYSGAGEVPVLPKVIPTPEQSAHTHSLLPQGCKDSVPYLPPRVHTLVHSEVSYCSRTPKCGLFTARSTACPAAPSPISTIP